MPEICRFMGIVIRMYFSDHPTPHFHAKYAEHSATIGVAPVGVLAGRLPPRVLALVVEWASVHEEELFENWTRARRNLPLLRIAPLE
jgi:hypothetical protein